MDELIDILDKNGKHSGKTCLKSEAHKNGLLHGSVHIWFYTREHKILFQKRSKNKIAFPSLWDISVAGHISSGETIIEASIREIEEEIGISIKESELNYIGTFHEYIEHSPTFIDNEIHFIFIAELKVDIKNLNIQDEELSAVKLITINEFEKELFKTNFKNEFVPHSIEYYKMILQKIRKKIA